MNISSNVPHINECKIEQHASRYFLVNGGLGALMEKELLYYDTTITYLDVLAAYISSFDVTAIGMERMLSAMPDHYVPDHDCKSAFSALCGSVSPYSTLIDRSRHRLIYRYTASAEFSLGSVSPRTYLPVNLNSVYQITPFNIIKFLSNVCGVNAYILQDGSVVLRAFNTTAKFQINSPESMYFELLRFIKRELNGFNSKYETKIQCKFHQYNDGFMMLTGVILSYYDVDPEDRVFTELRSNSIKIKGGRMDFENLKLIIPHINGQHTLLRIPGAKRRLLTEEPADMASVVFQVLCEVKAKWLLNRFKECWGIEETAYVTGGGINGYSDDDVDYLRVGARDYLSIYRPDQIALRYKQYMSNLESSLSIRPVVCFLSTIGFCSILRASLRYRDALQLGLSGSSYYLKNRPPLNLPVDDYILYEPPRKKITNVDHEHLRKEYYIRRCEKRIVIEEILLNCLPSIVQFINNVEHGYHDDVYYNIPGIYLKTGKLISANA